MSQTASLRGPVSGLLYDAPSRSVRPLVGFPGSSYLGKPALEGLDNAFIAPDGQSAVVVEKGNVVLIRGLGEGIPSRFPLSELTGQVQVSWAANSGSLVIYSASARSLLRFDLGTSGPIPGEPIDLSYLEGDVVSIVTNKDASQTVIGLRHPVKGGLYGVTAGASALLLSTAEEPGPAIFSPATNSVYAIEAGTRRILRFAGGIYGGSEQLTFSGELEPLSDPVGLALSPDGQRLLLAGGSDQMIREYDLRSQALRLEIRLDLIPQRLSPLARIASVFVLAMRDSREQPLWLLDTRVGRSVYFAPASE